jgi:hypothetical protein
MDFNNLCEYYEYLENDTNFQYLDLNTYKYITVLRDKTADENTKQLCSYELFFADFSIEKGVHIPKFQSGGNAYPTLELFNDFEYIKERAKEVINPKYKAKYNHLLWLSSAKHIDFAKEAIESYLLLLQNSSFLIDDNLQCFSFVKYFKNLFVLCQTINHKKDETLNYLVSLLESDKINDFTKYSLMDFVVGNSKKIDSSITKTFYDYSKNKIARNTPKDLTIGTQLYKEKDKYYFVAHKKITILRKKVYFGKFCSFDFNNKKIKYSKKWLIHSFRSLLGSKIKHNTNLFSCTYFSGLQVFNDNVMLGYGINDTEEDFSEFKIKELVD